MKIIVDMMGGDNAPLAVLEGAAQAVKEYGVQLIGVGDEALVRRTAQENSIPLDGIELVNCTEVIDMCDEPARAIRQKKDSSIVVGLNMLKDGKGDAFVSAGSTGALHVGASLIVRTLKGIKRPALATMVPAKKQAYLLLDCGANVECRPEMLAAFAVMGSCYVNRVEGRRSPSVVSDAFEALIAALYLDGGMDVARSFILPFITEGKHAEADYKTRLQEIVQQNPEERLSYVVESESGPDHDKHFVVAVRFNSDRVARGEGRSKKAAEQCAAKEALKLLGVIKEK